MKRDNWSWGTIPARAKVTSLAALVLLGVASPCSGATYYVDFLNGSDNNAGTSSSAPWKRCPGDPQASGQAGAANLAPGDVVRFRGGTTYVGTIYLKWSGTAGTPITYVGNSWGNGKAYITTNNSPDSVGFSDNGVAREQIIIEGFLFRDIGGYAEDDPVWLSTEPVTQPPGGAGISLIGGSSWITIRDCEFKEIGQWQNVKPMSGTGSVTGVGVSLQDNYSVLIDGCDFTRMKTGVSVKARTSIRNITISDCSFHNYMNWLIDVAPRAKGASLENILIDRCVLFNYKEFDTPNWQGFGEKPHQDGIFLRAAGMASTWTNVVIRNTIFYSDDVSNGGTASIYISEGPSADIYNCVFLNDHHSNASINIGYEKLSGMTQRIRIFNNTFVGQSRALKVSVGNSNPDEMEILNNLFFRMTEARNVVAVEVNRGSIGRLSMDNNHYYSWFNPVEDWYCVYDGAYRTLGDWKQVSGLDGSSRSGDPLLLDISGAPSRWDAQPGTQSSPLVDSAASLSGLFSTDQRGVVRTSPWDIGAFESTFRRTGPAPPKELRVVSP